MVQSKRQTAAGYGVPVYCGGGDVFFGGKSAYTAAYAGKNAGGAADASQGAGARSGDGMASVCLVPGQPVLRKMRTSHKTGTDASDAGMSVLRESDFPENCSGGDRRGDGRRAHLMTKYANRDYKRYALIAGFTEIGGDGRGDRAA